MVGEVVASNSVVGLEVVISDTKVVTGEVLVD